MRHQMKAAAGFATAHDLDSATCMSLAAKESMAALVVWVIAAEVCKAAVAT